MTSLTIQDLAVTADLDSTAMSAVHGGTSCYSPCLPPASSYCAPQQPSLTKNDFSFNANQALGQCQNTEVNNGNNAAFVCGINSTVTPHQTGCNTINVG
jgi:hypothetical protein